MTLANQWTLKLPAIEAVHHIMTFDPSDSNFLYLMTSHHVRMWLQELASSIEASVDSPHFYHLFIHVVMEKNYNSNNLDLISHAVNVNPPHLCLAKHAHTWLWPHMQTIDRF